MRKTIDFKGLYYKIFNVHIDCSELLAALVFNIFDC
jgi:hypothetical protein